jgi:hypothetical protein
MEYGTLHVMIGIAELWRVKMAELVKAMQNFVFWTIRHDRGTS